MKKSIKWITCILLLAPIQSQAVVLEILSGPQGGHTITLYSILALSSFDRSLYNQGYMLTAMNENNGS